MIFMFIMGLNVSSMVYRIFIDGIAMNIKIIMGVMVHNTSIS